MQNLFFFSAADFYFFKIKRTVQSSEAHGDALAKFEAKISIGLFFFFFFVEIGNFFF